MAALLILVISAIVLTLGRRSGYLPVGWFWFVGTLVPVIGLVQVGSQSMADRYAYIPSIGIFVMAAWGACDLLRGRRWEPICVGTFASLAIVLCLTITRRELVYWHDGEILFRHAIEVTEPDSVSLDALGEELAARKRLDEAIPLFQQAVQLSPDYLDSRLDLAAALLDKGRFNEATKEAIEAVPNGPSQRPGTQQPRRSAPQTKPFRGGDHAIPACPQK